jgi:hypothetical protein
MKKSAARARLPKTEYQPIEAATITGAKPWSEAIERVGHRSPLTSVTAPRRAGAHLRAA